MSQRKKILQAIHNWFEQVLFNSSVGFLVTGLIVMSEKSSFTRAALLISCAIIGLIVALVLRVMPLLKKEI